MTEIAEEYLNKTLIHQAYFFVGVNKLTEKHLNGKVTGNFTDPTNLVKVMEQKLDHATKRLKKHVPKFILCHVIRLDIGVYNKEIDPEENTKAQNVINEGLPLLNVAIDSINMNTNVKGPWLTDTVHSLINCRRVHKYKRLPNGKHPDTKTCDIWAKKLVKAIEMNL